MQYLITELMFNTYYLAIADMLSLRCLNLAAYQAYDVSNVKTQIYKYMLQQVIKKSGICDSDLNNLTSKDLVEILNIISQQYYDNIFGNEVKVSLLTKISQDKLYPLSWPKIKNSHKRLIPMSILRLNRTIKINRNLDAILNYANPPRNRHYDMYESFIM